MMRELLKPKVTTALEIAILVQSIPLEKGAALIEQYARTVASEAAFEAAIEMSNRVTRAIEGPMQTLEFP